MSKAIWSSGIQSDRDILAHWAWALPVLLIVAYLSIRQIDLFAPSPDEFNTMYDLGWLANEFRSPQDIVATLIHNNPSQSPGYFLLLSMWGNLTSHTLAIARVMAIYGGSLDFGDFLSFRQGFRG